MADLTRRYLLILLLRSYNDLLPGLQKSGEELGYISRGKKSGVSKAPQHVGEERELWRQGSYDELHRALHRLADDDMPAYHAVWIMWIIRKPSKRDAKEHMRYVLRHREAGERGLKYLEKSMPRSIRVPVPIQEDAGHVRRPA